MNVIKSQASCIVELSACCREYLTVAKSQHWVCIPCFHVRASKLGQLYNSSFASNKQPRWQWIASSPGNGCKCTMLIRKQTDVSLMPSNTFWHFHSHLQATFSLAFSLVLPVSAGTLRESFAYCSATTRLFVSLFRNFLLDKSIKDALKIEFFMTLLKVILLRH